MQLNEEQNYKRTELKNRRAIYTIPHSAPQLNYRLNSCKEGFLPSTVHFSIGYPVL